MAIGKTAGCLIAAMGMWASAAQFSVRHDHLQGGCDGVLTVNEEGVRYAGEDGHSWKWPYGEIQQFKLEPDRIEIVTYRDNLWRLGADREYRFEGKVPAAELYELLRNRLDQRFVAALAAPSAGEEIYTVPVKHQRRMSGSQGLLTFGSDAVVYSTDARGESRTWRYGDIENISSSGPFQLTLTTFERARSHYGDRKGFNFQLKAPITEAKYNQLWYRIERKNGKIQ